MKMTDRSCAAFVAELASAAPVPGGGGAAALVGAIGAALGNMVAALTIGKRRYADVEDELRACSARCAALRETLLSGVQADADGFLPLSEAFRMPKDDPRRADAIELGALQACRAPMEVMVCCRDALLCLETLGEKGSLLACTDAGCGAAFCRAALDAAALNVRVNTALLQDRARAEELEAEAERLRTSCGALADKIYDAVCGRI